MTQCIPQKGHQAAVQVAGMGEGKHRSRENSQEPLCLSRGEEGVLAEDETWSDAGFIPHVGPLGPTEGQGEDRRKDLRSRGDIH